MHIKRNLGQTHLVIPDSHAAPGVSNKRYEWLGKLIADLHPDVIINIGDHWDMASLCSYDKGKKGFEGRRYLKDIESGVTANDILSFFGKDGWNEAERIFCLGNHEQRIERAVNSDPALEGVLGYGSLELDYHYDRTIPFLDSVRVDGVNYSHYFTSGVMGRPIGGEHPAYTLLSKHHQSCTQGHSHLLDYCRRSGPTGSVIQGLSVGCYFDHKQSYAGPANSMWWRGVVVKRNVKGGNYDLETISLSEIKKAYGGR